MGKDGKGLMGEGRKAMDEDGNEDASGSAVPAKHTPNSAVPAVAAPTIPENPSNADLGLVNGMEGDDGTRSVKREQQGQVVAALKQQPSKKVVDM